MGEPAQNHGGGRYLTGDVPGIGGRLRERPEDFLVDEIPAYEPCGSGEHIYLLMQKREMTTTEMVEVLAKHFGVRRMDVGYAGLKDKHALTRQVVSIHVPGRKLEDFPSLQHEKLAVMWADYHTNKLRLGHLKGNRFSIRIRGVHFSKVREAKRVLDVLERQGFPNRVGEQRFGLLGNNHELGATFIAGDFERFVAMLLGPDPRGSAINADARAMFAGGDLAGAIAAFPRGARAEQAVLRELLKGKGAKRAVLGIDRNTLNLYVTALQSAVYNALLDERLDAGTFAALGPGDLAFKHENGAVFPVDDATAADPNTRARLDALEISPTGPLWGAVMTRAAGAVDEREVAALSRFSLTPDHLEIYSQRARHALEGKRRPFRVPLMNPDCEGGLDEHGPYVRVVFDLPRGAFATAVLPEIMKSGSGESGMGSGAGPVDASTPPEDE